MIEKEKYLRLAADFDNYRKRSEGDMRNAIQFGTEAILLEIADVLDAIERSGTEQYDMKALLEKIIKKQGMIGIETRGRIFDPATMEAISTAEGGESQMVQPEVRAGYMMHDRIIRPARVIIYQ